MFDSRFFRCLVAAVIAFALLPGVAEARKKKKSAPDVGSGLVGNTVELTGPQGTTKIFYRDRKTIVVRTADGAEMKGSWRVKGKQICTRMEKQPENCTSPIEVPPVAGSSGILPGANGAGDLKWAVTKGKGF
jgi:hypothetical protein